jgi:hypothetical protein
LETITSRVNNPDADRGKFTIRESVWATVLRFLLHVSPRLRFDVAASLSIAE